MTPETDLAPLPDHAWIAARIPHSGAMCLLDSVDAWDDNAVRCVATSHRHPDNPLRANGRLAAVCGIEYAAQAMAVHGALLAVGQTRPRAGFLTSVRAFEARVGRLDTIDGTLFVEVSRMSGNGNNILYSFALRSVEQLLLTGRATVMLDAADVFASHAGRLTL